jgi:hypothetical protein
MIITRRTALIGASTLLAGCDRLNESASFRGLTAQAERANFTIHRSLQDRMALAREFAPEQRSRDFRANGTRLPSGGGVRAPCGREVRQLAAWWSTGWWRARSRCRIIDLRAMPPRALRSTRHDCVEGWSAIGQWTGAPLKLILDAAGLKPAARFLVFHCADTMRGSVPYYESIDLLDAFHPQTILAWGLNGELLDVPHGAPVRLRVERQLGYKHAKYVQRIEAVADLAGVHGGKGGYWEDSTGYEWYAGI